MKKIGKKRFLQILKEASFGIFIFAFLYICGLYLPVGYDWNLFRQGIYFHTFVPWTEFILNNISLPFLFAITVFSLGVRAHRHKSKLGFVLTFISLPTLWVLFLGNFDGLVIFGLLLLPIGAPLVLLKPQIASFALLARLNSLLIGIVWLLFSFLIWGFWPVRFLAILTEEWASTWSNEISLFPWGLVISIPLMLLSLGDEDLLMAAGSLATPHLFPYHFIVLMPALGRMKWHWMILTWFLTWMPLSANWIGEIGWHAGNLASLSFWFGIYLNKSSRGPITQ